MNLEVEEDLSIMATLLWADGVWMTRLGKNSRRRGGSGSLKHRHRDR